MLSKFKETYFSKEDLLLVPVHERSGGEGGGSHLPPEPRAKDSDSRQGKS